MFHIRDNGEWWRIKGQDVFITGVNWYYLNFWHIEAGGLPEFRIVDVEDFLFTDFVARDPNAYGDFKIKPRREGGTERALCIGYEGATRYREAHFGNMANDDKRAAKNFKRLIKAHRKMIWFFKPINKGSDNVQKELRFEEPEQKLSRNNYKEVSARQNSYDPLGGYIDYAASTKGAYDGDRNFTFLYDEVCKIFKYDPNEQWEILKPTFEKRGGMQIIGKAKLLSTVEEFANGKSVEYATKMWDDSDPTKRDGNGRTANGLYRYFRSALVLAEPDEFGFPKTEEFLKWYQGTEKAFLDKKDYRGLSRWKRKYPMDVNDALQLPDNECILFPALLEERLRQIKEGKLWNNAIDPNPHKAVYGQLVWENGIKYGRVKWIPAIDQSNTTAKEARWCISEHPAIPNAGMNNKKPANYKTYSCGIDPIDTKSVGGDNRLSLMGITVKSKFNGLIDSEANGIEVSIDENDGSKDILNPEAMRTNRIVCDYQYRQDDPDDAFDDIVKTLYYFGCQGMVETNRVYVRNKFREAKKENWLANEILVLQSNLRQTRGFKGQDKGINSNTKTNEFSNEALIEYVENYWKIIDHPRVLKCMRGFAGNAASRTKSDLTVSFGWCLAQDVDPRYKPKTEESEIFKFDGNPLYWR